VDPSWLLCGNEGPLPEYVGAISSTTEPAGQDEDVEEGRRPANVTETKEQRTNSNVLRNVATPASYLCLECHAAFHEKRLLT
jgi:hypothetical protein